MKKVVVIVAVLVFVLTGSMAYAGQFGPPEPAAKKGKVTVGLGYFYSTAKLEPDDKVLFDEVRGTRHQVYLQAGYGFAKNWEAYLRVGGADMKIKDAFVTSADDPLFAGFKPDFKDGLKPFGTIGVKGVFNVSDSFGIGPFFQASLYSRYEDSTSGTVLMVPLTQTVRVKEQREINLGVGFQGKIGEAILYAGPVAYWSRAKVEASATALGVTITESTTFKERNNIGGFAGLRVPLSKGLNLEVEGQLKSRFSFGGALTYAF